MFDLLTQSAPDVAAQLLGSELVRQVNGQTIRVRIVEVEAYHQTDAASHSRSGITNRTEVMFGPSGRFYVYFTYGMHHCASIITGPTGEASAVFIRAVEPLSGWDIIRTNRPNMSDKQTTNGPGKFCKALAIDKRLNGHDLSKEPLHLKVKPSLSSSSITQTTRVGIAQAKDKLWRWYITDNPYVSKKVQKR